VILGGTLNLHGDTFSAGWLHSADVVVSMVQVSWSAWPCCCFFPLLPLLQPSLSTRHSSLRQDP
jgi:hypothetical protein